MQSKELCVITDFGLGQTRSKMNFDWLFASTSTPIRLFGWVARKCKSDLLFSDMFKSDSMSKSCFQRF